MEIDKVFHDLASSVGFSGALSQDIEFRGSDPVLATDFPVAGAAAAAIGLHGACAADLWDLRGGEHQKLGVDATGAAASLIGFLFQSSTDQELLQRDFANPATALYPCGDGRWIHLHGGFDHLREGILDLLKTDCTAENLSSSVKGWSAQGLEDALAEKSLCGAMVRTPAEWRAHPQGQALAKTPVIEIEKIAGCDPVALPPIAHARPLDGVRVIDCTRVLAGPTCARTLASHGAQVIRIGAEHLQTIPPFVTDTSHGKRMANLDLREPDQRDQLKTLVQGCDVFSQGYRQGKLSRFGFGPEDLAAAKPGIIYVSINCYGHDGPWAARAGWEQLAQTVTGVAHENGADDNPQLLPAAATDYTTGYLAAAGVMQALKRRATEGGSYHVRVSLSRTAMWLLGLERIVGGRENAPEFDPAALAPFMMTSDTPLGTVSHLGPILEMSVTPPDWKQPTSPLGHHQAEWV